MRSLRSFSFCILIAVLLLSGCSRNDSDLPGNNTLLVPDLGSTSIPWSAMMNGYLVSFEGRTYENDITTFLYTVSGEQADSVLSYFFLEIPECAPQLASYFPVPAYTNTNPYIGIYGIKWESYLYVGETRSFMVCYPGDIPLGMITTSVKVGESVGVAEIAGPCKGYVDEFEISGTVYIDADGDGIRDAADASGISNVTVTLVNGNGGTWTALTDPAGLFEFIAPSGSYVLRIDPATAEYDFNEDLALSFDATTPLSRLINIGPDSQDNLFGFDPRIDDIIEEIQTGTIQTNGETPKFWVRQMRAALRGHTNPKILHDAQEMMTFLVEIQGLFLEDPFQFTPGSEFAEAIEILKGNSPDPMKNLLRELLAAELNHVSDRGMIEEGALQAVMLAWVEEIVYDLWNPEINLNAGDLMGDPSRDMLELGIGDPEISDAIDFLENLNMSIGGGSGGGG